MPTFKHLVQTALAATLLSLGLAQAQISLETAQTLAQKAGILANIDTLPKGMLERAQQKSAGYPAAQAQAFIQATAQSFSAEIMKKSAVEALAAKTLPATAAAIAAWYQSPLGAKIGSADIASAQQADRGAKMDAGAKLYLAASPARKKLLNDLWDAGQSNEGMFSVMLNMIVGLAQGIATAEQGSISEAESQKIRDAMIEQKPKMIESFQNLGQKTLAETYAAFSDAELALYLAHLLTPAGRNFSAAGIAAMDGAFKGATQQFGVALGRMMPPKAAAAAAPAPSKTTYPAASALASCAQADKVLDEVIEAKATAKDQIPYAKKMYDLCKAEHGTKHKDTLVAALELALDYDAEDMYAENIAWIEQVLPERIAAEGEVTTGALNLKRMLGQAYYEKDAFAKAKAILESTIEALRKQGDKVPAFWLPSALKTLSEVYAEQTPAAPWSQIITLRQEALALSVKNDGVESTSSQAYTTSLAYAFSKNQQPAEAAELLEKLLPIRQQALGADHEKTLHVQTNLTISLSIAKAYLKARTQVEALLAMPKIAAFGRYADILDVAGDIYGKLGQNEKEKQMRALYEQEMAKQKAAGK